MNTRTIELPDGWTEELRTEPETGVSQYFILDENGDTVDFLQGAHRLEFREWCAWEAWRARERRKRDKVARAELEEMEQEFHRRRAALIVKCRVELQQIEELVMRHRIDND